jgi:hypothetical protein
MIYCKSHEAHEKSLVRLEKEDGEIWTAVGEIRNDIKGLLVKIGTLVGGIAVLNTIAILLIELFIRHQEAAAAISPTVKP